MSSTLGMVDGDLSFAVIRGVEAIRQQAQQALLLWLGEWYRDTDAGSDLRGLLGRNDSEAIAESVQATVLAVDEVTAVRVISLTIERRKISGGPGSHHVRRRDAGSSDADMNPEPARVRQVREYVGALSGLGVELVIPANEPLGRAPLNELYASVKLISDEDLGRPSVRYRATSRGTRTFPRNR